MPCGFSSTATVHVVKIIRKGTLPDPSEGPVALRPAAAAAQCMALREPRPASFPLLFSSDLKLLESAIAFLHEHAIQRAYTAETLRTYAEILYDWFDSLEQTAIAWNEVDASDLIAYRDRMLKHPSSHTGRPFSPRTINHRVRGVLRFYTWAVRHGWLRNSPLTEIAADFPLARRAGPGRRHFWQTAERSLFVLRQFENLPRPLTSEQARELLAELNPPYDLMARWQLYTGLRVGELLQLVVRDVLEPPAKRSRPEATYRSINIVRKGRKPGYVIASTSLLEETAAYIAQYRAGWTKRSARTRGRAPTVDLFVSRRGSAVRKNTYQQAIARAGEVCGFKATSHLLRASFGCWLLARLEQIAKQGAAINPLLIVKILMGHEHIETTDRYLRAVAIDIHTLSDVLDTLLAEKH
jgi:integrase/recombinase XerD